MAEFHDQLVVVTGAAGAVGSTLVTKLLASGARVGALDRKVPPLPESVSAERFVGLAADLTDEAAVESAFDRLQSALGPLHGLANVAGTWRGGVPVAETPLELFDALVATNLRSAFLCSRAAMKRLQPGGRIVSVAALTAFRGANTAGSAAYNVTKAGVVALSRALADEGRAAGIRSNAVAPGTIRTRANEASMPSADVAKWATLDEVADALLFALTPDCPVNGTVLTVPGRE